MPTLASDHRRSLPSPSLSLGVDRMWCLLCTHRHSTHSGRALSLACSGKCLPFDNSNNNSSSCSRSMFSPIFAADLRTRVRVCSDSNSDADSFTVGPPACLPAWQNIHIYLSISRPIPVEHLFRFFALSTWPAAVVVAMAMVMAASLVAIKSNLFVLFYVKTHGNTS